RSLPTYVESYLHISSRHSSSYHLDPHPFPTTTLFRSSQAMDGDPESQHQGDGPLSQHGCQDGSQAGSDHEGGSDSVERTEHEVMVRLGTGNRAHWSAYHRPACPPHCSSPTMTSTFPPS